MQRSGSGDHRARLFVALELPAVIRGTLSGWSSQQLAERADLRPVACEALHVTLCFLGWRAVGEIEQIGHACAVLASHQPASVGLGEAIWLPRRQPRVLAVGLRDCDGTIARAQAQLSQALHEGNWYVPESRPFLPHVTIARVTRRGRTGAEELRSPPDVRGRARTVTLYRSRLGRNGARYEALHSVELGRPERAGRPPGRRG